MVFAHHPVDDPSSTKSSQLGDREEVKLIEHMLTNFREGSGKPVTMVGSHAQVAFVHQIEGVNYVVLPSSGKDPYGTPDHGGFTGWDDWSIDPEAAANQQWLTGNIHAFAQSITLNAPEEVEVKTSGVVGGSIVQPEGVENGTRVVPLRYPMSVDWGGSPNLAIGSGQAAIEAAKAEGKTAILDPSDGSLTGLAPGRSKCRSPTIRCANTPAPNRWNRSPRPRRCGSSRTRAPARSSRRTPRCSRRRRWGRPVPARK